jgi:hypothetical protein
MVAGGGPGGATMAVLDGLTDLLTRGLLAVLQPVMRTAATTARRPTSRYGRLLKTGR